MYLAFFSPVDLITSPRTNGEGVARHHFMSLNRKIGQIESYVGNEYIRLANNKPILSPKRVLEPYRKPRFT